MNQVKIFDTTLRDGEQSPGCSMNLREKLEIARSLERLRVDVIEAGFAISSPGDFESVSAVSKAVKDCTVASLARAAVRDIDAAWEAVRQAADPRIHLFIATSQLHMTHKLKMKPEDVLAQAEAMVAYARKYCANIEFSAEDAMRSEPEFLAHMVRAAVRAGAKVVNIPDTVGYTTPEEMRAMIEYLITQVDNPDQVEFSVHCHNDLGLATANSLAGVQGGARQVECTVNGLGERSGNAALEEIVMALHTRANLYGAATRIDTTQISRTSRAVYSAIGQSAPLNKPIVGKNAFAHEAGIHQHGMLADKRTYEILTPESVGLRTSSLVLGKHSGRHALENRLSELGYTLSKEELLRCFEDFKVLCDKKKTVSDEDLEAIASHYSLTAPEDLGYKLERFVVNTSNYTPATGTVALTLGEERFEDSALGDGPIDAVFKAIDRIIQPGEHTFDIYTINSVSEGKDTLGDVKVKIANEAGGYVGRGLSTDIIEASILAYLGALGKMTRAAAKENA